MKRRNSLIVVLVIFLMLMQFYPANAEASQFFSISQNHAFFFWYGAQGIMWPFGMVVEMNLRYDYSMSGLTMTATRHYNSGIMKNVGQYPFRWFTSPVYFRWYVNGSRVRDYTTFQGYSVIIQSGDRFWGGRHTNTIQVRPLSDIYGQRSRAISTSPDCFPGTAALNMQAGSF